ncbi:hypothetical protein HDG40_001505 [Paraburkholderia sp. JPY158]|uniref:Uncharacterized protein n=1 Tax=Paraburkholderia atlantica TaxID=2654982 RepID=A0A7W8Q4V6_PARAM|nr:hypothetical protein [Paraburkholderia atlantica]
MAPYATSRLLMLNSKSDENSKPVYKQKSPEREFSPDFLESRTAVAEALCFALDLVAHEHEDEEQPGDAEAEVVEIT